MTKLWANTSGSILVNASNQLLYCETCPCGECACGDVCVGSDVLEVQVVINGIVTIPLGCADCVDIDDTYICGCIHSHEPADQCAWQWWHGGFPNPIDCKVAFVTAYINNESGTYVLYVQIDQPSVVGGEPILVLYSKSLGASKPTCSSLSGEICTFVSQDETGDWECDASASTAIVTAI